MRIVSLLPSATEIVCAIGGRGLLVGRSHECDHPAGLEDAAVLTRATWGGEAGPEPAKPEEIDRAVRERVEAGKPLYQIDEALLADLRPDLILTQDLCSVCSIDLESVRRVAATLDPAPEVLSLNPTTVEGVLDDHLRIGAAAGLEREAELTVLRLRERLYQAADYVNPYDDGPVAVFLDWTDPLYVAGHWTAQMVERAGARHPLNPTQAVEGSGAAAGPIGLTMREAGPSRRASPEELAAIGPEALVIAPCGVGLEGALEYVQRLSGESWWEDLPAVRMGRVAVVDGNAMFNRPGPRLVEAQEWLVGWLNGRPEVGPPGFPARVWPGRQRL